MKISNLVKVRNFLKEASVVDALKAIESTRSQISHQLQFLDDAPELADQIRKDINYLDSASDQLNKFDERLPNMISDIDREISSASSHLLSKNQATDESQSLGDMSVEQERAVRNLVMRDSVVSEVTTKIRRLTDWHYPALEIGPGDGVWTGNLVAADPLYVVDIKQEYLDNTLKQFNPTYQHRIRPYLINNDDLSVLPKGQFGLIFSWNVFNYLTFDRIENYLKQCFDLLRPGGSMVFSFNDADTEAGADFAEKIFMSWTPKPLVEQTCLDIGYEIVEMASRSDIIHWAEIRRPGELRTIKAHQVMGAIRPIS